MEVLTYGIPSQDALRLYPGFLGPRLCDRNLASLGRDKRQRLQCASATRCASLWRLNRKRKSLLCMKSCVRWNYARAESPSFRVPPVVVGGGLFVARDT